MAIRLFSWLFDRAHVIRTATLDAENTAERVGEWMEGETKASIKKYDPASAYEPGQICIYNGVLCEALLPVAIGQSPTVANVLLWKRYIIDNPENVTEGNTLPISANAIAKLTAAIDRANAGEIPAATELNPGAAQFAGEEEINLGSARNKAVSPYWLKQITVTLINALGQFLFTAPANGQRIELTVDSAGSVVMKNVNADTLQTVMDRNDRTTRNVEQYQLSEADTSIGIAQRKIGGALLSFFGYLTGRGPVMQGASGQFLLFDRDNRTITNGRGMYAPKLALTSLPLNDDATGAAIFLTREEIDFDGTPRTIHEVLPLDFGRLLEYQAYTPRKDVLNLLFDKQIEGADVGVINRLEERRIAAGFGGGGGVIGGATGLSEQWIQYLLDLVEWNQQRVDEQGNLAPKPTKPNVLTPVYVTRQYIDGLNSVTEADPAGLQLKVVEDLNTGAVRDYTGTVLGWSLSADLPGVTISPTGKILVADGAVFENVPLTYAIARIVEGTLDFPFSIQNQGCTRPAVGYFSPQLVYHYGNRRFTSKDDAIITMRRHFAGLTNEPFTQFPAQMENYNVGTDVWGGFGTGCEKASNGDAYVLDGNGVNGQLLAIQIDAGKILSVKLASEVPNSGPVTVVSQYIDHNNTGEGTTAQIFEGAAPTTFVVRERLSDNSTRNYAGQVTAWRFSANIPGLSISSVGSARLAENSISEHVSGLFVQCEIYEGALDKAVTLTNVAPAGGTVTWVAGRIFEATSFPPQ